MKTLFPKLLLFALFISATRLVCSANVVGYYNVPIYHGDNLIANQFEASPDNTLNSLFSSASVPDGSTFRQWDPVANVFTPISTYDEFSHLWDINYSFNLGRGGILNSPTQWTNTFVGSVHIYTNIVTDLGGGDLWNPNYANGLYLLDCPDPIGGSVSNMFANIVGRGPNDGEWVAKLNPATQTYLTTTYHAGNGTWDNGNPSLSVGEAAWVNLGPVANTLPVPEPSCLSLAGLVAGGLFHFRRRK